MSKIEKKTKKKSNVFLFEKTNATIHHEKIEEKRTVNRAREIFIVELGFYT